jgi:hypothetical protein
MEDLFLEVNHGPFVVDNNIFLSPMAIRTQSQGGAYLHNLIAGAFYMWPEPNRFTPYFLPHSTDIAAMTTILSGDDRLYNNIFVGPGNKTYNNTRFIFGSEVYNNAKLPVWISGNGYCNRAKPYSKETAFTNDSTFNPGLQLEEKGAEVYLQFSFNQNFSDQNRPLINTAILGRAKIPRASFDNRDGSTLTVDYDYFGNKRSEGHNPAGPFVKVTTEKIALKVW